MYAADRPNAFSPAVAGDRALVYVPNSKSNTVDVIDPTTYKIVEHFAVGRLPQHVVPSYDLKTLWVANDLGNSLTPIDPHTGLPGTPVPVDDPYNLYFTADGSHAIVVAERLARLDFRDAKTMRLTHSLPVPCRGIDHLDFSADGSFLVASCEFSGTLLKIDVATESVVGRIDLPANAKPQDVRLAPSGKKFYVADMTRGGVYTVDSDTFAVTGFVPTGMGAHGLYPSRDSKTHVRDEPRRGNRVTPRRRDRSGRRTVDHPERQPGHGWRLGRRHGAVGVGSLQRRGVRDRHRDRATPRPHPRGLGTARPVCVPATRSLLTRAHRHLPPMPAQGRRPA